MFLVQICNPNLHCKWNGFDTYFFAMTMSEIGFHLGGQRLDGSKYPYLHIPPCLPRPSQIFALKFVSMSATEMLRNSLLFIKSRKSGIYKEIPNK